jgi:hypothetical protein
MTPPPQPGNSMMAAIEAAQRAEDMQRQQPQPAQQPSQEQQLAAHIDGLPISDHKKRFLRQYPQLLSEPLHHVMRQYYQAALQAGVEDDTPQMDQAILEGVQREIEHHRKLTSASARPTPENAEAHDDTLQSVSELTAEAAQHLAERAAEQTPVEAPVMRRNIPMSAPVSREVHMASGGRTPSQITLSRDEREIANSSFRHLPPHQREMAYAKNKRLMLEMKRDGRLPGDR